MKITALKIRTVEGRMPAELDKCDLAQGMRHRVPRDVALGYGAPYPVIRPQTVDPDGTVKKKAVFLTVETDESVTGVAGPLHLPDAAAAFRPLAALLKGQDPYDTARLWHLMYRTCVAPGPAETKAIGAVDIALWDIKCKAAGLPLHKMLGGRVQSRLPVYASSAATAFYDGSYDLEEVARYVQDITAQGYVGSKWWIHRGPSDGERGVRDMADLVRTVREAGGPDHKIMIDCWCGWTYEYAMRVCERIKDFDIYFLEEPLLPAQVDAVSRLSRECPVRLALGEHLTGSWDFLRHISGGFRGMLQPDPCWCGGITETIRIMGLISSYDLPVCLHGSSVPLCTQVAATYPIDLIPLNEYLVNMMERAQWFLRYPVRPENGCLTVGDAPGCQMDINEDRVERETAEEL
ncbi:MAG: mandelate racemase/muconate lactonizing enzyme family protein [Oscillospiraceae bacterium]|nr:mandelate racemase/muconate lactonizing enzyme family protein [Oscillospiraceae bacterium]